MVKIPPLKIQGIKSKIVSHIQNLVEDVSYNGWIEPFMGSGVVGFNMNATHHIMNDVNVHIINFYNALKNKQITPNDVREFLELEGKLLELSDNDGQDRYREVRDRFNTTFESLDFLFLSRSCFNGMIRFNGSGKYNVPFCKKPNRFSKSYITKISNQVDVVSNLIDESWEFTTKSFNETINEATSDDLIYCDPPYMGRNADYFSKWSDADEMMLFDLLCNTKSKFIMSSWKSSPSRNNEHFIKYADRFKYVEVDHYYHVGPKQENRESVVEVLIYNY